MNAAMKERVGLAEVVNEKITRKTLVNEWPDRRAR
jgi:hypothetical protein